MKLTRRELLLATAVIAGCAAIGGVKALKLVSKKEKKIPTVPYGKIVGFSNPFFYGGKIGA